MVHFIYVVWFCDKLKTFKENAIFFFLVGCSFVKLFVFSLYEMYECNGKLSFYYREFYYCTEWMVYAYKGGHEY